MKPKEPNRFQLSVKTTSDQITLVLEGLLDGDSAWELIKRLEAYGREAYPVTIDLNGVSDTHWFAARILTSGLEHITRVKGPVFLSLPGRSAEEFSRDSLSALLARPQGERP